jgi:DNA ligase-associated metallophosphoesterase
MRILPVTSAALAPAAEAEIVLVPGRAAYLPATSTLLVADLHLGKAATFRSKGIPVPEGSAQKDLARLALLVAATRAKRLLVLGDLFHAKSGCTEEVFAEFTAARGRFSDTEVLLVAGNHDRSVGRLPAGLGIDSVLRTHDEPPFHFVHEPGTPLPEPDRDEPFTIAGHLHPVIALAAPSGDRLIDRCFVAEPGLLVMPAFGSFTGGHRMSPTDRSRVWIARDDGVADVTPLFRPTRNASRSAGGR